MAASSGELSYAQTQQQARDLFNLYSQKSVQEGLRKDRDFWRQRGILERMLQQPADDGWGEQLADRINVSIAGTELKKRLSRLDEATQKIATETLQKIFKENYDTL